MATTQAPTNNPGSTPLQGSTPGTTFANYEFIPSATDKVTGF